MADANNESELKVIMNEMKNALSVSISGFKVLKDEVQTHLVAMESRIIRMERAYDALGRRLEGSERHVEDEGWFD
jgi:hypothetical protein